MSQKNTGIPDTAVKSNFWFYLLLLTISFSCHKKQAIEPDYVTSLKLHIHTAINGVTPVLNAGRYADLNGDTFTLSKFKYYISNIQLTRQDGSTLKVPESYYLINAGQNVDTTIALILVNEENFTGIQFFLGIDSARNHTGAQTGALDPTVSSDMYWGWSAGYMSLVLDGTYKNGTTYKQMAFAIGGDENRKTIAFNSTSPNWQTLSPRYGKDTDLYLQCNVEEIFQNPVTINLTSTNTVDCCTPAKTIASNYADMFSIVKVSNP